MTRLSRTVALLLLSRWSYIIFAVALVVYNVIGVHSLLSTATEGTDYWEHLASMYSFARDPAHPSNPYVLSDEPTHLFTPYHLFWGAIARALHIHPFWMFPIIAGVNMLLFVVGAKAFSRKILRDERYALVLALTMLCFWYRPWEWSGFYNLGLLPLTAVYPYWFALPVSLLVIAEYAESTKILSNLVYNLAVCCVVLVHPLTGSFVILSLAIKLLTMRGIPRFTWATLMAMPLLSTIITVILWPYFSVVAAVHGSGAFSEIGFAGDWHMFYEKVIWRILPALLGLPFLAYLLLVKKRFSYLSVGLVTFGAIYMFNYAVLHNSTFARYVIFIVLFCQVGIVQGLRYSEGNAFRKYAVSGYLGAFVFFGAFQLALSADRVCPLSRLVHRAPIEAQSVVSSFRRYRALSPYIGTSDVVMAPIKTSWKLPAVLGCKVVGVEHSNPFLSDYFERMRATEMFFGDDTAVDDKLEILSRYSVNRVLVPIGSKADIADLAGYLTLLFEDGDCSIYSVGS